MKLQRIFVTTLFAICGLEGAAQTIPELKAAYSGQTAWDAPSGKFAFRSSGTIDFKRDLEMSGIWTVPPEVKVITIAADTRVTGQFTVEHACRIEGEDRLTSVLHGTDRPAVLHEKGLDRGGNCMPYSSVFAKGGIDVSVTNLTTLNPLGFMWTGVKGARLHLDGVRGIDDRGGWSNHSDGIQAGRGSTVRNCHLETGDDAIKVYNDILVENTTIKMIQNCVPVQLGWGDYGDGARGVFRNVTIVGDRGRGRTPAVIEGTRGHYRKTLDFDGLRVAHPKAALISLREESMTLDLTIANAEIAVQDFSTESKGTVLSVINGSPEQTNRYTSRKQLPAEPPRTIRGE